VIATSEQALKLIRGRSSATAETRGRVQRMMMVCDSTEQKESREQGSKSDALELSGGLLTEVHNLIGDGTDYVRVVGHSWLFDALSTFSSRLPVNLYPPKNEAMKALHSISLLYEV
jgi:hypothetical protein